MQKKKKKDLTKKIFNFKQEDINYYNNSSVIENPIKIELNNQKKNKSLIIGLFFTFIQKYI